MKIVGSMPKFIIFVCGFFLVACLLPGMIPMNGDSDSGAPAAATPVMEKDPAVLIERLKGQDWVYLQALAEEQYTEEDFAKPGTLRFTVNITDDKPTYFNYGWCTTTEEILQQNFEHIRVQLYFNDEVLGTDVVHPVTFTRPDGFVCLDFGVLMSNWSPGEYQLKAVATFNEQINDGADDFEAGDYVFIYNVTVQ